ncbi:MAG: hypothetical protein IPK66_19185 [Rhodospirillales bacterium]|nr:hypothetical protein [Rhodospirillales bacterium]
MLVQDDEVDRQILAAKGGLEGGEALAQIGERGRIGEFAVGDRQQAGFLAGLGGGDQGGERRLQGRVGGTGLLRSACQRSRICASRAGRPFRSSGPPTGRRRR